METTKPADIKFFSVRPYLKRGCALNFFLIGRGVGKTYSSIEEITERYTETERKSVYIRNTDVQLKACMSKMGNPFKKYNADKNTNYQVRTAGVYNILSDAIMGEDKPVYEDFGYAFALSTFHNMRGLDLSDVDVIWMEEFIQAEPLRYDQFRAFCQMYETINRNREMLGEQPVQVIFTANSQSLNNPILAGFGLIPIIEKMDRRGQEYYQKGDILICRASMEEFTRQKSQSLLYRNIEGSAIYDENLNNEFANDSFFNIENKPLREYRGLAKLDDMYIYAHKSNNTFYVCRTRCECPTFTSKDTFILFMRTYGFTLRDAVARGDVYYSEFQIKANLEAILKL